MQRKRWATDDDHNRQVMPNYLEQTFQPSALLQEYIPIHNVQPQFISYEMYVYAAASSGHKVANTTVVHSQ